MKDLLPVPLHVVEGSSLNISTRLKGCEDQHEGYRVHDNIVQLHVPTHRAGVLFIHLKDKKKVNKLVFQGSGIGKKKDNLMSADPLSYN